MDSLVVLGRFFSCRFLAGEVEESLLDESDFLWEEAYGVCFFFVFVLAREFLQAFTFL